MRARAPPSGAGRTRRDRARRSARALPPAARARVACARSDRSSAPRTRARRRVAAARSPGPVRPRSRDTGSRAPPSGRTRAAPRARRCAGPRPGRRGSARARPRALRARTRGCRAAPARSRRARCASGPRRARPGARRGADRARARLPIATVCTCNVSARSRSAALRRESPRSYGRCSSTKKRSRPKDRASRAAAFGSCTASPCRAQPERQTSPSLSCSSRRGSSDGGSGSRPSFGRVPRVRGGQQPAEVRVALRGLDEQRDVQAAVEGDLRPGDRPDTEVLCGVRELERPVDAVVVGEGERRVAELGGPGRQLLRLRRAVEERVGRVRVKLDVAHPRVLHEHMFVCISFSATLRMATVAGRPMLSLEES